METMTEDVRPERLNSAEFKKYVGMEAARRALRRNVHFGDNTVVEYDPEADFEEQNGEHDGRRRVPLTPVDSDRPPPTRGILSRSSTSARQRPPQSPRRGKPASPMVFSRGGRNFMLVQSELVNER